MKIFLLFLLYVYSILASSQSRTQGLFRRSKKFFDNYFAHYPNRPNLKGIAGRNLLYKLYGTGNHGEIAADADSVRVLLHPETMKMMAGHSSNPQTFIKRCMAKRPLSFYHIRDTTVPRLSDSGAVVPAPTDHKGWVMNTNTEYLTYPEIQLSSLLLISSNTRFLNNCSRSNKGIPGAPGTFHPRGVIVGVVGPRFALLDQMDTKFIFVHSASTKPTTNPIDKVMSDYYFDAKSTPWNSFSQIQAMSKTDREARYIQTDLESLSNPKIRPNPADRQTINGYFDKKVYKKRLRLIIEPLFLDANKRAGDAGTTAYVVITGFGLGFWAAFDGQKDLFIQYVLEIVSDLIHAIPNVSALHFSHVGTQAAFNKHSAAFTTKTKISVIHDDTDPTSSVLKLSSSSSTGKDKLLVYAYAWDGNAYPGNEYWNDKIADSGDSQAASCSAITELHNPQINPEFMGKTETFGNPNPKDNASPQILVPNSYVFVLCMFLVALMQLTLDARI